MLSAVTLNLFWLRQATGLPETIAWLQQTVGD